MSAAFNATYQPRAHSRSASWSHTNGHGASAMNLLSPIRVFRDFVPSLTGTSAGSRTNAQPSHVVDIEGLHGITSRTLPRGNRVENGAFSRQASSVDGDYQNGSQFGTNGSQSSSSSSSAGRTGDRVEFYGAITWAEKTVPFIIILLSRIMWDHRLGILVFIGFFGIFLHTNSTIKRQVSLKERRLNCVLIGVFMFLCGNIFFIYYVFSRQKLHYCLIFSKPNFIRMDVWTVFWCVGITDFVIRFCSMAVKCLVIVMPKMLIPFRKRGKYFLFIEHLTQFYLLLTPAPQWYFYFTDYNMGGQYFAIITSGGYLLLKLRILFAKSKEVWSSLRLFWSDTRYGGAPTKEQVVACGNSCPICQEELAEPIELRTCKHIFCEDCISLWFDRERTCPMCRAHIADDPVWRDGNTAMFIQLF